MGKIIRLTESDLSNLVKKVISENDNDFLIDNDFKQILIGLHELQSSLESDDYETAKHINEILIYKVKNLHKEVTKLR